MIKLKLKKYDINIFKTKIVLYIFIGLLGFILIKTINISGLIPLVSFECIFFLIAFLSFIVYLFDDEKEKDNEYLSFSIINVICALFLLINESYKDSSVIAGITFIIYSIMYLLNTFYYSYKLYKSKKINYIYKFPIELVIGLLGLYVSFMVYNYYDYCIYVVGNYYLVIALLNIISLTLEYLFNNPKINSKLYKYLKCEKENKSKKKSKLREVNVRRLKKKD